MKKDHIVEAAARLGREQAFALIANKCTAAQAAAIKELKESRAHEPLGLTWEKFCDEHLGFSRSYADELIRRLDELGENYFRLSQLARISPETYQQISGRVTSDAIELSGEPVPLTPANAPRIRAAIQQLRQQLRRERERTRPNIAELHMMSDNVLKRAHELAAPTSGAIIRTELVKVAASTGARWKALSKALAQELASE